MSDQPLMSDSISQLALKVPADSSLQAAEVVRTLAALLLMQCEITRDLSEKLASIERAIAKNSDTADSIRELVREQADRARAADSRSIVEQMRRVLG